MTKMMAVALIAAAAWGQSLKWNDSGGKMDLSESGKPVLTYNYAPLLKQGAPDDRRRCCYIFPVYSPAGVSMLDDFPSDHWHHRGLFWAWPVVEVGGKTYDEWMNMTVKAVNSKTPVVSVKGGKAYLDAWDTWQIAGKDVAREQFTLIVSPATGSERKLHVELTLEAIDAPVTLRGSREAQKSYGGFSARFAARENTVLRADGESLTKDEDLTPRKWAELEGTYGGKRVVFRITPDPGDQGAPYQWCLRNYGFVGASFPGKTAQADGFTLEPGKPLKLGFTVTIRDVR
jgi:hypothetical protein